MCVFECSFSNTCFKPAFNLFGTVFTEYRSFFLFPEDRSQINVKLISVSLTFVLSFVRSLPAQWLEMRFSFICRFGGWFPPPTNHLGDPQPNGYSFELICGPCQDSDYHPYNITVENVCVFLVGARVSSTFWLWPPTQSNALKSVWRKESGFFPILFYFTLFHTWFTLIWSHTVFSEYECWTQNGIFSTHS